MKPSVDASASDAVRKHVLDRYLRPALQRGDTMVRVNVGEVHRELAFHNRVPLVCAALRSKKLLEENGLHIISQSGPPSGQSTTVTFTYGLPGPAATNLRAVNPLIGLQGVAKDLFKKLGGGEAFIRSERSSFAAERDKEAT